MERTDRRKISQKITIVIPSGIPRILTPNRSRVAHWGTITRAKNHLQGITLVCAIDARNQWQKLHPDAILPFEKGLLWYDLVVKDRRSLLDDDNAIAGLKYCRDMLQVETETRAGAGIISNDRDFKTAQVHWIIDRVKAPVIIITAENDDR